METVTDQTANHPRICTCPPEPTRQQQMALFATFFLPYMTIEDMRQEAAREPLYAEMADAWEAEGGSP
jgi:hypothetical protein